MSTLPTETGPAASIDPTSQGDSGITMDITQIAEDVTRYVIVEVNSSDYGFPTDSTVELMSSTAAAVTRVPKSPHFVRGVINHRGSIIPVVSLRRLFGLPTVADQARALIEMLEQREREHVEWLDALELAIRTGKPFEKPTDPAMCAFGRWYTDTMSDPGKQEFIARFDPSLRTTLQDMDQPHRRIHRLAELLLGKTKEGHQEEALARLEEERGSTLQELIGMFAKIKDAAAKGIKPMLVITELGDRRAAFEVDAVHTVKDCADGDIESLPDTASGSEFMRGLVHQPGGSYVLICDLDQMYTAACPR